MSKNHIDMQKIFLSSDPKFGLYKFT